MARAGTGSRGRVGPASDVYRLGVCFDELLTADRRFQAAGPPVDTRPVVLNRIRFRRVDSIRNVDPDLELIC